MFAYDKTFDPELLLGHCDLMSRFSDFASILTLKLVYLCPPSEGVGDILFLVWIPSVSAASA